MILSLTYFFFLVAAILSFFTYWPIWPKVLDENLWSFGFMILGSSPIHERTVFEFELILEKWQPIRFEGFCAFGRLSVCAIFSEPIRDTKFILHIFMPLGPPTVLIKWFWLLTYFLTHSDLFLKKHIKIYNK